jgi:acyl-coenzyme A thioesterase PaaI-like protein
MELPHTAGCVVCGRENPQGLRLSLHVSGSDDSSVHTEFRPGPQHIGFEGIIHGGLLATVLDEAMVWAATWAGKRFCVAGELNTRFRAGAAPGKLLHIVAKVESIRSRLIETVGTITDADGRVVATGDGKYIPLSTERHREFVETFVDEPATAEAARLLRGEVG